MVDYAYRELFDDNVTSELLICSNGAIISYDSETGEYSAEGSPFLITNENIVEEEFTLDEKLCTEDNLKFGLCESAYCTFPIFNDGSIPNLKDVIIDVYFVFNNDMDTLFQVGTYIVAEDVYSADRETRDIAAYDYLYFVRDIDISDWYYGNSKKNIPAYFVKGASYPISNVINSVLYYIREYHDIPIELADDQELLNGNYTIGKTIESSTITFSFFMQRLLEVNGVFGHMNRQGKFVYIKLEWYTKDPKREITDDDRIPPTPYDDIATWGIGEIDVYDQNNNKIFKQRNSTKTYPSIYCIVDSFVFSDKPKNDSATVTALKNLQEQILWHLNYRACEVECSGDLCLEVGDRFDVLYYVEGDDEIHKFRSYVLERRFTGIAGFYDTYSAKGDKKQPKYKITNDRWHNGDSSSGTSSEGTFDVVDDFDPNFIEKMRNINQRVLDEPSNVSIDLDIEGLTTKLKWTDPEDLTDEAPIACEWAGTYVVRRENEPPVNIYQGTIVKTSTTRDEYADDWFVDDTIEENKVYYYGIFPFDTNGNVRWTKVLGANTNIFVDPPEIDNIVAGAPPTWDGSELDILWASENNKMTVQVTNSHIVFKLYTGETETYSFTSPVGSTPSDVKKIHVSFLKDDTNQVAKPSFIYHTGSGVYSYNQESPTDAEMGDIYGWLVGKAWVSLTSILKNPTEFDSHFKKSGLDTPSLGPASIADLSSYFGTDWTLKGGNGAGIVYSSGEFTNQQTGLSDSMFLPLDKNYKIYGIRGKFKVQDSGSRWDIIVVTFNYNTGSGIQEISDVQVGKLPTDSVTYGTDRWATVSDNNYHDVTFEFSTPFGTGGQHGTDVNYINIAMATRREYVKDLEFLVQVSDTQ